VLLSQGNVSMFHPNEGTSMRVKAGGVSVVPAAGFKTLGEVAMLNGSVVISAKEGSLQVNDRGTTKNVVKGQTIVIAPKTADTKVGGGGGSKEDNWLDIGGIAAGGVAAVLAGIAISRANGAKTSADAATSAAEAATSAANAAGATAATAAANAAQGEFYAGCIYNEQFTGLPDSPYVPPTGQPCPDFDAWGLNGGD